MQKVYLLLRSNQQTGPFSLEELIQFDLKPFDLIWIEGKSAGWYYPQEIQALRPHLSFLTKGSTSISNAEAAKPLQTETPKKIFVAMPSNIKEEPITKPSFSAVNNAAMLNETVSSTTIEPQPEELKTSYTRSLDDVETDYMNWAYAAKKKKTSFVSMKGAIAACLLIGVAVAAWFVMKPSAEADKKEMSSNETSFAPAENELPADSAAQNETIAAIKPSTIKKQKQKDVVTAKASGIIAKPSAEAKMDETPKKDIVINNNDYGVSTPVINDENKTVVEEKTEPVTADAPKEKKKLREKFLDLFKKKPKEEKAEDAKPVEEENGQRNSTRREAGSNLAQLVRVQFSIPNDWMMGVKGAKATLTNRSSETISKAVVEVVYYNDENEILDKKTIVFGNIKSKSSQTISVPDHATATRLDYSVVSATGVGEPFAKL